ncbi:hypothetical protein [Pseudoalteromonas luteoviolacea]|uniref:Lipoprotein n=1 Tax=Pseudoalteromonas luteoviolacea S4060-1 TaxID=1365257 RepID=A0A167MX12_9GAMM|nr:hypothetical protein [Pseudoalteromonas luteoviolacea]KZN67083.1 hypothetical protein N478_19880 [Pseudoalteromonas luteoviolacea S4060-1]
MTSLYRFAFTCLYPITLVGCQITSVVEKEPTPSLEAPCWLQAPVQSNQVGFIGTAAPFSATQNGSLIASRKRALVRLLEHYAISEIDIELSKVTHDSKNISLENGQIVYFSDPHITADTLYSYASTSALTTNKQCQSVECDFSQCQPSWLCQNNHNSVIGVSYYTAFAHQQIPMSAQNAKILAGYLSQARVNVTEQLRESYASDAQSQSKYALNLSRQGDVSAQKIEQPILMTNSCTYGATLFANYSLPTQQEVPLSTSINWRERQEFEGRSIVLGNFGEDGTIAPDNLLSSAIKFAIRDALVELAKIKGIEISSDTTLVQNEGRYFLNNTYYTIAQTVNGRLLDIQINYKDGFPNVYVWLLEGS